jgi:prevent-host-death family protein
MKFVSSSEARSNLSGVMDMAQHDHVVVTRQGRPAVVIMGVANLDPEQVALGLDDALWEEIERARAGKYVSSAQMKRELGIRK